MENGIIPAALILSGGLGLGAYQAGALAALLGSRRLMIGAIAGSSMGAINAAIIAGNEEEGSERLLQFWRECATETASPLWLDPMGLGRAGHLRHASNWMSVLTARLSGVRGLFRLRPGATGKHSEVPSLYDVGEAEATLSRFIDFDLLNSGRTRLCVATTDVETAETVVFDTAAGDRIGVEHLLASGGLLPNFQPVRIGGRLLGDGGLSANAPLEPFLASDASHTVPSLCFLLDLFPPDGTVPMSLEAASGRSTDLQFAAQTLLRLKALQRERSLATATTDGGAVAGTDLFYLSYRPSPDEAQADKQFDFSRATLADRIDAGVRDGEEALGLFDELHRPDEPGLRVHRVRRRS